jgi:triosephosphate isomerase (TIM)
MRRPMVAGNWKMHGSRAANSALARGFGAALKPEWPIDIAVFPPYVYLADAVRTLDEGMIAVGAQDVCAEPGAFTGEVAAAMLKDVGCSLRDRGAFGAPALVPRGRCAGRAQVRGGCGRGLTPVLCVGETLEEREAHKTEAVMARQIDAVIA